MMCSSLSLSHTNTPQGAGSNCGLSCRGYCGFCVLKAEEERRKRRGGWGDEEGEREEQSLRRLTCISRHLHSDLAEWLEQRPLDVLQ